MSAAPNFTGRSVLVAKGGPGGVLGNCPFSQKANLALRLRGVPFEIETVDLENKPDWFLELNEAGTTPVFVGDGFVLKSSDDIVDHADKVGTKGAALNVSSNPHLESANECAAPVFSAFVSLMKNRGDDAPLKAGLMAALEGVEKHLKEAGGKFLLGDEVSAVDCNLAPKLWHIAVAGKYYKDVEVPEAVQEYIHNMEGTEEWKLTTCPDELLISGWGKYV